MAKLWRVCTLVASCFLFAGLAGGGYLRAQVAQVSETVAKAAAQSRQFASLSGTIELTWKPGPVMKKSEGTIQLARPNRGRIALRGDYPEVLLVSDGKTRYFAADESHFQTVAIDAQGTGVDSPWWGLPFRFFFTGSVNPFGEKADPSATYRDIAAQAGQDSSLREVQVTGNSPMGGYSERLFFTAAGDLVESSVQFGEGPNAAIFKAKLTNVSHKAVAAAAFRFKPLAGQVAEGKTDNMLAVGASAPTFTLPSPEGKQVELAQLMKGRKAVLVNFWYYNCAPCRVEFPEFEKLYEQFEKQGLTIVAIDKGDTAAVVAKYVRSAGLSFPVALGGEATKGSVFARYKVGDSYPGSYLLDGDGKVVYRSSGEDMAGLKQALAQIGFK